MKSGSRWIAGFSFLLLAVIPSYAQSYGYELSLGADAFKNGHYDEAIVHFRKATELDPTQIVARIYLANAYVSVHIPGVETEENLQAAERAIEQYHYVLGSNAPNETKLNATKRIADLYLNMKQFNFTKDYYQRASALDPKDPEPYYSIGVVDWTLCYQPRADARAALKMKPDQSLSSQIPAQKKVCDELRIMNLSTVEDGIDNLNKAIELRPDYDDAMAYLNLMYRERAALECDNLDARAEDLKTADRWVDKTLATKRLKAAKADRAMPPTAPNPQ